MGFTPATPVTSPQQGLHPNLQHCVTKHLSTHFQKPIAEHTLLTFEKFIDVWQQQGKPPLILDSGCGTGRSSHYLAQQFNNHLILGIDRSNARLSRSHNQQLPENLLLLQAECSDFWRLAEQHHIVFAKHFLLYPNPYPKPEHLQRRWHGHPAFRQLLSISSAIELRTNWKLYAEEFTAALRYAGQNPLLTPLTVTEPITAFEEKYYRSGHNLWRVVVE